MKLKLTNVVLPQSELAKLSPQEKKRYVVFTTMLRDLNILQKCLLSTGNVTGSSEAENSGKVTISFFFLKTFISKICEMWTFLKRNNVDVSCSSYSDETKENHAGIVQFFADQNNKDIFRFIRDKFGFHYEYQNDVDSLIEDASDQVKEYETWLSEDSGNEIFSTSNTIIMEVIFSEMKRLGFSGTNEDLLRKLFDLSLCAAKLFREFGVYYLVDAFNVKWEKKESLEVEAPEFSDVSLPFIVGLNRN